MDKEGGSSPHELCPLGKIVLGYIRTETEQAMENKPVNTVLLCPATVPASRYLPQAPAPTSLDEDQDRMLSILLHCSPPYFMETVSLTDLKLSLSARLTGQGAPGVCCLCSPMLWLQTCAAISSVHISAGDPDSGPHTCRENFHPEPCPGT